jgi:hypothetical protein
LNDISQPSREPPDYLAYMLRLWRMRGAQAAWRASLEDPHSGERLSFASLDEVFAFLKQQTGQSGQQNLGR